MKHILFAYDGKPEAEEAKVYVLSRLEKGDILDMLHLIPTDLLHYGQVDQLASQASKKSFLHYIQELGVKECSTLLAPFAEEASQHGIQARLHVRWGNAEKALLEIASSTPIDEIILSKNIWGIDWHKDSTSASLAKKYPRKITII